MSAPLNAPTPGPWQYAYNGHEGPPSTVYAGEPGDETFIADLCDGLPPLEIEANARLIAAAPALLAALERSLMVATKTLPLAHLGPNETARLTGELDKARTLLARVVDGNSNAE